MWLILADDLTGAADCAITFGKCGMDAVVAWGERIESTAEVLSVDVDSRRFAAAAAVERQMAAQKAHWRSGYRLYKKIDSTLRGQPVAELAAQLAALAAAGRAPLAVVAPAFPATGRLTLGGRVVVNDRPLEETPLWARDHSYGSAHLPTILAEAGLTASVIGLDLIHRGADAVQAILMDARRRGLAAVVCDCAAVADLDVVAAASLRLADEVLWVGSGGLAGALARLVAPADADRPRLPPPAGAVLIVVGSLAEISRAQARSLVDDGVVRHVPVAPATLLAGRQAPEWRAAVAALSAALAAGGDVLLEIALTPHPDLARGAELAARLAEMVDQVAPQVTALVATGGDTACALLSRLGVHGIRLLEEVEPGVPLGLTLGAISIPVVTKAGGFGDTATLRRCLRPAEDLKEPLCPAPSSPSPWGSGRRRSGNHHEEPRPCRGLCRLPAAGGRRCRPPAPGRRHRRLVLAVHPAGRPGRGAVRGRHRRRGRPGPGAGGPAVRPDLGGGRRGRLPLHRAGLPTGGRRRGRRHLHRARSARRRCTPPATAIPAIPSCWPI